MNRLCIGTLIALLLAGCTSLGDGKKHQSLTDTLQLYEKAIRWGDFTAASRFQHEGSETAKAVTIPGKVRVSSYRQVSSRLHETGEKASVTVHIDYYHHDNPKLRSLTDEQTWEYDQDKKAWFITTPLPAFR